MRVGETRVGEMREVKRAYTSDPRHIHIHKIFMELDMGIDGTSFSSRLFLRSHYILSPQQSKDHNNTVTFTSSWTRTPCGQTTVQLCFLWLPTLALSYSKQTFTTQQPHYLLHGLDVE